MTEMKEALPLAANIRFLRKQEGLSQSALGEKIGLSRSNIASYENAKAEPRAAKLAELAQYFQVSLERLITGCFDANENYRVSAVVQDSRAAQHHLTEQLASFDQRNARLKQILAELTQQEPPALAAHTDQTSIQHIASKFDHMLTIMQELLRNDQDIVEVIQAKRTASLAA